MMTSSPGYYWSTRGRPHGPATTATSCPSSRRRSASRDVPTICPGGCRRRLDDPIAPTVLLAHAWAVRLSKRPDRSPGARQARRRPPPHVQGDPLPGDSLVPIGQPHPTRRHRWPLVEALGGHARATPVPASRRLVVRLATTGFAPVCRRCAAPVLAPTARSGASLRPRDLESSLHAVPVLQTRVPVRRGSLVRGDAPLVITWLTLSV